MNRIRRHLKRLIGSVLVLLFEDGRCEIEGVVDSDVALSADGKSFWLHRSGKRGRQRENAPSKSVMRPSKIHVRQPLGTPVTR
jgi:hypothetical protein